MCPICDSGDNAIRDDYRQQRAYYNRTGDSDETVSRRHPGVTAHSTEHLSLVALALELP